MASASDGVRVQAEEFGQNAVASVSQLDRFQPSEQTTLLLVKQAVEKQDGRFQFIGRYLESGGISQQRNRLGGLPGAELIASLPAIGGRIKEPSGHLRAAQTVAAQIGVVVANSRLYSCMKERDRLAALGSMAAGLAHEVKNPLGAIKGAAQLLEEVGAMGADDGGARSSESFSRRSIAWTASSGAFSITRGRTRATRSRWT